MKNFLQAICIAGVVIGVTVLLWPGTPISITHRVSSSERSFNKHKYSVDQAASIWAVVNKGRALASGYVPADLVAPSVSTTQSIPTEARQMRQEAALALEQLFQGAQATGHSLKLLSAYRSYAYQVSVHDSIVKSQGSAQAEAVSALPGHSEHQTGLAADVGRQDGLCNLDQCFGDKPEGQWLLSNAYKYGYIVRYQAGTEKLTGYEAEPWHIRYVGKDLALQLQRSRKTMEQFFGLPVYTDYPEKPLVLK